MNKQRLPTMALDSSTPVSRDAMISLSDIVMVNPMTILPKPNEFDFNKPEAWPFWKERFRRFGRLAVRQWGYSECDWIDLLCYTMGQQSEEILEQIMPEVANKSLAEVLQAFTDYFDRTKNVTLQRYKFNSRIQLPGESIEQFITALQILAESCQYGIMKDELIRDRIVAGLSDTTILEKLQLESCLTLENVIAIAGKAEIERSQCYGVSQDLSSTGEINCAVESSEAQQFPSDKSNDSKSLDPQSCEFRKCRKTEDREIIGGKPTSVSCARTKDSQKSAEKETKDCDIGHNQETHSLADKVESTATISVHLDDEDDEAAHVTTVYETVQQVMNDLKPQNFVKSVNQIKMLKINSQAALEIAVDLIHKKAVDKPRFSETLALMCKELAIKQASRHNSEAVKVESYHNCREIIIARCETELDKNSHERLADLLKPLKMLADPKTNKEFAGMRVPHLFRDSRRILIKSLRNIGFMVQLFKQGLLPTYTMHKCIRQLLALTDEKSLECLCKLFSTIGKDLESKNRNLEPYFKQMLDNVNEKGKVSSRVRLMLQDVVELRLNKWIPRSDDSNPKTMGQIQKEAEAESLDTLPKKTTLKRPRQNNQNSDNRRNYAKNSRNGSQQLGSKSSSRDSLPHDTSRSQSMSMPPPQPMKSNPPAAPASTPNKPVAIMTDEELVEKAANILEEYLSDTNIDNAASVVRETFDNSTFSIFVREILAGVLEKSVTDRKQVSQLMTHLISENILSMSLYLVGLVKVMDMAEDLVIDTPKIWVYLAELILYPLAEGAVPFSKLKTTMAPLKNKGLAGKLMGELMIMLVQEKGPKWIKDKWCQANLRWCDFLREDEKQCDFIKKYKLQFFFGPSISYSSSLSGQLKLSMEQIHERLVSLMSNEKDNSLANICSWISANVGERVSEPQFITALMNAILKLSIEPYNNTFRFRSVEFHKLRALIFQYTHRNEVLQIQCLNAIAEYIHKLGDLSCVLWQIFEMLWDESIISHDAFFTWQRNKGLTITGESVAIGVFTSFLTSPKEADDESTGKEETTLVPTASFVPEPKYSKISIIRTNRDRA